MTSSAEVLYKKISQIPIKDLFGSFGFYSEIEINPTRFLFNEDSNRFARFFAQSDGVAYEKRSDYERFELLVRNLDNMRGSAVYRSHLVKVLTERSLQELGGM